MDFNIWQAMFLGVLQGVSELFPVSSLAQTILLPALLGWKIEEKSIDFLAFVVALHLATAVALFIYFLKDWILVIKALIGSAKRGKFVYDEPSKFAWLLVSGTIVVGLAGLAFEKHLRELFNDQKRAWIVAAILVVNGLFMIAADIIKKRAAALPEQARKAEDLTIIEGASIGATQTLALLPGISRSGATIVAGLLAGLSYEQASRFSFMLATPVIALAALKKVPALFKPDAHEVLKMAIPSAILAGITAYLSTRFLMRYFKNHRLAPFGWYCIVFGLFALIMLKH